MRSRYPSASNIANSFGPGPLTPAVKALIIANTAMFVLTFLVPDILIRLALIPEQVIGRFAIWQCVTYLFLHGGFFHILFNMLTLWMFGVELERMWGTKFFTRYYFITGIGAGLTQIVLGLMPFEFGRQFYYTATVGASGAIYGLLLAYALYFPNRPIYMYLVFPIPARYFVMILGGINLLSTLGGGGGGVAYTAHLGGLATGYLYLKSGRIHPISELKYRFLKWRINRMRRKFDVYSGGRSADDVNRRVH
jgi:membrane associated rhomboid family serine protease